MTSSASPARPSNPDAALARPEDVAMELPAFVRPAPPAVEASAAATDRSSAPASPWEPVDFPTEHAPDVSAATPASIAAPETPVAKRPRRWMSWLLAALAIATVAQGAYIVMVLTRGEVLGPTSPAPIVPAPATPVIPPPPVDPLAMTGSGAASSDPASVSTSATGAAADAPAIVPTGTADIRSTPPGARVTVDGEERGVTPLLVSLTEGLHSVVINDGRASTTRTVDIAAGALITVSAELGPPPPTAGWVSFVAPFEMQIVEDGDLLGTTRMARLMLPAGRHRIDLVNGPTHFKTTVTVNVQPGRTTKVPVAVPDGSISINALPWANVTLDGKDLGATPIATLSVPIGTHELILRHPKLGDRRQTVIVPANEPLRLVVDLR